MLSQLCHSPGAVGIFVAAVPFGDEDEVNAISMVARSSVKVVLSFVIIGAVGTSAWAVVN